MPGDMELLRDYLDQKSEPAFAQLVSRYINLVYSAAMRHARNPHQAQEITQAVFLTLARKARTLGPGTVLSSWLFQTTRLTAANFLRAEQRRHRREQEAYMQSTSDGPSEPGWPQIAPLLDEAITSLCEKDRDAIVLRFVDGKSFREIGGLLGATEDAAKMRVSRALERLREYFVKRGIAISATLLGSTITANTVQAAPIGLAAAVVGAALQGAAFSTSTMAATKGAFHFMAWTKTNIAIGFSVAAVVATQWHQIVAQRSEIATLQKQQANPQSSFSKSAESAAQENELRQLRTETAQLQSDLRLLRSQVAAQAALPPPAAAQPFAARARTGTTAAPSAGSAATTAPDEANEEAARQLGLAAAHGDHGALKKLEAYALAANRDFSTNSAGLSDSEMSHRQQQLYNPLRTAFDVITAEAKKNIPTAMQAIAEAASMPGLKGHAVKSIGALAGEGNESALEILLNHDKYQILTSSAVSALKPAAENGDQRAISALSAVTADPKNKPLWYLVASGLKKPAESGNDVAIDTLIFLAGTTNQVIRDEALRSLKNAAQNNHAKAASAVSRFSSQ